MTVKSCPQCRAVSGPDDRFCSRCGAPQTAEATREELSSLGFVLPMGRSVPSIVASYLGLLSFMVVPAPFAVILGIYALWDLKRRPHLLGRGRSIFAIVAGVAGMIWTAWLFTR